MTRLSITGQTRERSQAVAGSARSLRLSTLCRAAIFIALSQCDSDGRKELPVAARCREHRYLHAAHDTAEHDKSDDDNSSEPFWLTPLEFLVELDAHRADSA